MPSEPVETRHYAALDGLRGLAAFSVLAYHIGRWLNVDWLAANGDLSVDMFFCLSGYVLPLAYGRKAESLPMARFLAIRLVRLMPMIVLAVAISAAYVIFRSYVPDGRGNLSSLAVPVWAIASAMVLGALDLPYFGAPAVVGGPQVFPLNGPQYTLFFELFANVVWWGGRRLPQVATMVAVILVAIVPVMMLGLGGDRPATFISGFPRVCLSFACGVLLFHLDRRLPPWSGWTPLFWALSAAMMLLFFAPAEAPFALHFGWLLGAAPLLVLAGARVRVGAGLRRFALRIGALSFPLYALHYPIFCWINGMYRAVLGPQNPLVEGPLVAVAATIGSYLALTYYDAPIRALLSRTLLNRRPPYPQRSPTDILRY